MGLIFLYDRKKLYIRDMKTKLLRKLREKSKKRYWIEKALKVSSKPYMLKSVNGTIDTYSAFEYAKEICDTFRREYIEKYISERKKRPQTKTIY